MSPNNLNVDDLESAVVGVGGASWGLCAQDMNAQVGFPASWLSAGATSSTPPPSPPCRGTCGSGPFLRQGQAGRTDDNMECVAGYMP